MRISQAYISQSVADFPFYEKFGLEPYTDINEPAIFFGCYSDKDLLAILRHRKYAVIYWCGQDALDFRDWDMVYDCFHVTCLDKVWELINNASYEITPYLLKQFNIIPQAEVKPLGNKIYAYLPMSHPRYHGIETLINLNSKYEIIIGDGSIPQNEWHEGKADEIYSQCFIGLVLSNFAGGGQSIIEMGIRGIKVVTNVLTLPNVINWNMIEDIETAIQTEAKRINKKPTKLAESVIGELDNEFNFLNTDYYD